MVNPRVTRGRQTEDIVAAWFRNHGAPGAKRRPASLPGTDVYDMPGLAPEVKATSGDLTGALKQAVKNANGELPFVVWRPSGYGPERLASWPTFFRFADATWLLQQAGLLEPVWPHGLARSDAFQ